MNGRRNTLGSLSPSQLNSRNGPARVMNSQGPKKRLTVAPVPQRPSISRPSEAFSRLSSGNPRGSVPSSYGGKSSQIRNDPRPVTDKQYQQTCIHTLISYLGQHGYDHVLSPKLLANPTSKEFLHMVQFLFKRIDPSIKFLGKIEDEVPALFKQIGYPFQISKSALYAVGSPHTWPGLLAALNWLVELLTYEEMAEEEKKNGTMEETAHQNAFYEYVGQAYRYFLSGDDERVQELDEQLAHNFKERDTFIQNETEKLLAEKEALEKELETIRSQPSPLEIQEKKKADLLSDIDKFNKLISSLQSHKHALEKKVEERKQDLVSIQTEKVQVDTRREDLRGRIAAQEINLVDVERMSKEKSKMKEILRSVSSQRDSLEKEAWDLEVKVSKKLEDLESAVRSYHTLGDRMKLIPSTAKRANGVEFEISLNTRSSTPEEVVGIDLKGTIKPALLKLKEDYIERATERTQDLLRLQERIGFINESKSELEETKEIYDSQVKKLEAQFRFSKEKADGELKAISQDIEKLLENAKEMGERASMCEPQGEEEYKNALEELEKTKAACEKERKKLRGELVESVNLIIEHKAHITETLESLKQVVDTALEDVDEDSAE